MKKFSMSALAKFMTSSATTANSLVRRAKYPNENEAKAVLTYYRDARRAVARLHGCGREPAWLAAQATMLDKQAESEVARRRTRLRTNASAVRAYARHFGHRNFGVLDIVRLGFEIDDVRVTATPDLFVVDQGRRTIVKLDFGVQEPKPETVAIITQTLFEAARSAGLRVAAKDVRYFDVRRGREYRGARLGSRRAKDIRSACVQISALWGRI